MNRRNLSQRFRVRALISGAAIGLQLTAIDPVAVARAQTVVEPLPMLRDRAAIVGGDSITDTWWDGFLPGSARAGVR